jgi:hypothetical protein
MSHFADKSGRKGVDFNQGGDDEHTQARQGEVRAGQFGLLDFHSFFLRSASKHHYFMHMLLVINLFLTLSFIVPSFLCFAHSLNTNHQTPSPLLNPIPNIHTYSPK